MSVAHTTYVTNLWKWLISGLLDSRLQGASNKIKINNFNILSHFAGRNCFIFPTVWVKLVQHNAFFSLCVYIWKPQKSGQLYSDWIKHTSIFQISIRHSIKFWKFLPFAPSSHSNFSKFLYLFWSEIVSTIAFFLLQH